MTGLSWVEYLEALAQLADSMSLPTDDDLATLGARDMLDFEHKLQSATDELAAALAYRGRAPSSSRRCRSRKSSTASSGSSSAAPGS